MVGLRVGNHILGGGGGLKGILDLKRGDATFRFKKKSGETGIVPVLMTGYIVVTISPLFEFTFYYHRCHSSNHLPFKKI